MTQLFSSPSLAPSALPSSDFEQEANRLRQANFYLRTALEQVEDGVLILMPEQSDHSPYVIYSNCQANLLVGVDPTEGLRHWTIEHLTPDAEAAGVLNAALRHAIQSAGAASCECPIRVAGVTGGRRCFWRVRAVMDEHGEPLNYTLVCKTAPGPEMGLSRIGHEETPDQQAARLRVENTAALAQGIAHDVNNLLGPMMTMLSSTLQRVEQQPDLKADLQLMFGALKRARQFTQQVVRATKGREDSHRPTDLEALARDTATVCAAGSNVTVNVTAADGLQWAMADPVRMSQILQNLVINGIQAMPGGGRMHIDLGNRALEIDNEEQLPSGSYVELRVCDRGFGMSEEILAKLFNESFTTKADGNGIGLTTCARFVREHGGYIGVRSTINVGTEFRLLIPAVKPDAKAGSSITASEPIPLIMGEGKVMIVDDEEPLHKVALRILRGCGYEVVEADNGEDAIALYKEETRKGHAPDVVLMDLTLRGGLTGSETAREILEFDSSARLVVTSGSVTEDVQRIFLSEGFMGVLPKPYEAGALSATVRDMIVTPKRGRSQCRPSDMVRGAGFEPATPAV